MSIPQAPAAIWSPSPSLSPRVRRLREEFFSFAARDYFRNEVRPYGSGTPWDEVWSPYHWGVVPEMYPMFDAVSDSLLAAAETVPLPDSFWDEPLVVRRALFFCEVVERCLPVKILDGELIVGSYFNTALSKTHARAEARSWQQGVRRWREKARELNDTGAGNCGAVPGHLIPSYPKVLRLGFRQHRRRTGGDAGLGARRDQAPLPARAHHLLRSRHRLCRTLRRRSRPAGAARDGPGAAGRTGGIVRICRRVPAEPAATFQEALQSLWFAHMLVMAAESYPGPGLSPGRIDQYLYPFYQADMASGRLDRQQARELLQCLSIKHNYAYDYQGRDRQHPGDRLRLRATDHAGRHQRRRRATPATTSPG